MLAPLLPAPPVSPVFGAALTGRLSFLLFMMVLFPCPAKDFVREVNHVSRKEGSTEGNGMAGKRADGSLLFLFWSTLVSTLYPRLHL